MGIATGQMPNVELIWSVQRSEGQEECFGRGLDCTKGRCRWREQCLSLDFFARSSLTSLLHMSERDGIKASNTDKVRNKGSGYVEREPVSAGALGSEEIGSVGS